MHASMAGSFMVQREGDAALAYVNGICPIKTRDGKLTMSKSVQSVSAGKLNVHLTKNYDGSGAKVYTLISLLATPLVDGAIDCSGTNEVPGIFDEIKLDGTTIALADLTVWL
jgi:hypothetical protein